MRIDTAPSGTTQLFTLVDLRLQGRVRSGWHWHIGAFVYNFGRRVKRGRSEKDRSASGSRVEACTLYCAFAPGERELHQSNARFPPADVRGAPRALDRYNCLGGGYCSVCDTVRSRNFRALRPQDKGHRKRGFGG